MSELISGKEALIAIANGEDVEVCFRDNGWSKLNIKGKFDLGNFSDSYNYKFRTKPHTITINGIDVPAPFEPKIGDVVFVITNNYNSGYQSYRWSDDSYAIFGAWRTEDEIKQVVEALRSIFK